MRWKIGTFAYPAEKSDNIVSAGIIYGVNRSFVSGREGRVYILLIEGRGRDSNGENSNIYL